MTRSRQSNRDIQHGSDSGEEESNSDERPSPRGRSGRMKADATQTEGEADAQEKQVDAQIEALMAENAKSSGA